MDAALLTDAEYATGPEAWVRMDDPLPPWPESAATVETGLSPASAS